MELKRASEYLGVDKDAFDESGAFDAVMGIDSLFFVDGLLLEKTQIPEFKASFQKVRKYFQNVITLLKTGSARARTQAVKLLTLREIKGVGIGYGDKTDDGSAIGPELAERLASSGEEIIKLGIEDPAIFELMGLFETDFGPDRLSDSLINILQENAFAYTERVAKELGAKADYKIEKYETTYVLPTHPTGNKPIVFLPKDILRALPVANSYDEIGFVAAFNEELRQRFNTLIAPCFNEGESPTKPVIREFILANRERVQTLLDTYHAGQPKAYDIDRDSDGRYFWLEKAQDVVATIPVEFPQNPSHQDVVVFVERIIAAYKTFIETKGGWKGLYNDRGGALNERHSHLIFNAIALLYCTDNNIDISPQSNAGQGPVDFKLSRGTDKVVVELKLTTGHVKQGFEVQTTAYQESEEATHSFYVVIKLTDKSKPLEKILKTVQDEQAKAHEETPPKRPKIIVIDGTPKASASKAKKK